jgi:hypothetical protein
MAGPAGSVAAVERRSSAAMQSLSAARGDGVLKLS